MNLNKLFLLILLIVTLIVLCKTKKTKTLKVGDTAPDFDLIDENNKTHSLSEFKNKKVVLYFYPKDRTKNCTLEACQLRDAFDIYKQNEIIIIGISYDSPKSHKKFKDENALPFILLSDSKKKVAKLYGAQNNLLGDIYPDRKTILIGKDGKIIQIFENVDVKTHSDKILKAFNI